MTVPLIDSGAGLALWFRTSNPHLRGPMGTSTTGGGFVGANGFIPRLRLGAPPPRTQILVGSGHH